VPAGTIAASGLPDGVARGVATQRSPVRAAAAAEGREKSRIMSEQAAEALVEWMESDEIVRARVLAVEGAQVCEAFADGEGFGFAADGIGEVAWPRGENKLDAIVAGTFAKSIAMDCAEDTEL